ncbi:Panacea domain-containing protein [Candidatus Poriferisodalis sp.]|uniref:Panacea domain-containing protein n=1 Tax=Candidatus Poriferisodalis sp. TaxID=3101277 RepID=UPI003B02817F
MARVNDVVAYILQEQGRTDTLKLQKLLYYSQAWHLVWDHEPLFCESFEAWANGPVLDRVYRQHRGQFAVAQWPAGQPDGLSDSERETVDIVLEHYGALDGHQLSTMTHAEAPWREAREGLDVGERGRSPISLERMQDYYTALWESDEATVVSDVDWD